MILFLKPYFFGLLLLYSIFQLPSQETTPPKIRLAASAESYPMSYVGNDGVLSGLLPELLTSLFSRYPVPMEMTPFPWGRAQLMVEEGKMDGFCTFPSVKRTQYAVFTANPIYVVDYGYLIFLKSNPKASQLSAARSFQDLEGLKFISQQNVDWEKDNIPASFERVWANNPNIMFHLLVFRKAGDFFIMPPEQAVAYARKLGYEDQIILKKVDFIPNNQVAFHLGIRKTYPQANENTSSLDSLLKNKDFLNEASVIIQRYTGRL